MMSATPGMVAPTQIQQTFRTQRPRKPNSSSKQQMISKPPTTTSSPVTIVANPVSSITIPDAPKGPPVTVFVGNITEKAPDLMIRQILSTCGQIVSWKRVSGKAGTGLRWPLNTSFANSSVVRCLHTDIFFQHLDFVNLVIQMRL